MTTTSDITRDSVIPKLIQSLSGADEPKILLDRILNAAVGLTGATSGSIILIDKATEELSIEAAKGFADRVVKSTRLKIGRGITGWVAKNGKTLRINDVSKDKRYISLKKNIKSELAAPLVLNNDVIGVINVDSTRINAFSEDDESAIEALAALSSRVISDALIHDRLRRKTKQLETLVRIGNKISSALSVENILIEVTAAACELTSARLVAVRLLDEKSENLILAAKHGGSNTYGKLPSIPVEGSALGNVALSRIPLIIENIKNDQSYKFKDVAKKEKLSSMLAVPLYTKEHSLGVLVIYREKPGDFEEEAVTISLGLAGLAAAAIENARLFKRVLEAEKRTRQIEMKNAAREMGAELAHQIRNPLTVIKLLINANSSSCAITDADREVILRELKRIDELITSLLKNAGTEQNKFDEFDINELLNEILAVARVKAGSKNVLISSSGKKTLVRGERNEIWQAVSNVIDNAVQAAKSKVSVNLRIKNNNAEIIIDDNGSGIMKDLPIYDPLVTTKPEGVGIGLFSARRIILEHGGTITHDISHSLGGASFKISLPLGVTVK